MTEQNPAVGQPKGGRDTAAGEGVPGTVEEPEAVTPPAGDEEHDTGSRSAGGPMDTSGTEAPVPTEGIPSQVDAPSPADATDGDPPGGSVANQDGRQPDA